MTYKVIDIEGVGDVYAEKLIAAGITTDAELVLEFASRFISTTCVLNSRKMSTRIL